MLQGEHKEGSFVEHSKLRWAIIRSLISVVVLFRWPSIFPVT